MSERARHDRTGRPRLTMNDPEQVLTEALELPVPPEAS